MAKALTSLACLALLASGCAPEEPWIVRGQRIINGLPDLNPDHAGVVAVLGPSSLCSGTLVAPRVVLTAAHCAEGVSPGDFEIGFGADLRTAVRLGVERVEVHPDYDRGGDQRPPRNDLALLGLAEAPPAGVAPIPILPAHMGVRAEDLGSTLEFVGFGADRLGVTGVKLAIKNQLDWVCVEPEGCPIVLGAQAAPNTLCYDESPGGPCSGDSGGPALFMRGNLEFVAGATSYGDQGCRFFGCSTKVDAFHGWVADFLRGSLGTACLGEADCLSGFCARGFCCQGPCPGDCESCGLPGYAGICQPLPDGSPCGDGDPCTGAELCQEGLCRQGLPPACDDGLPCARGWCQPMLGCQREHLPDGSPCGDEDVCNGEELCQAGICRPGSARVCNDGLDCTEDWCAPGEGCRHAPVADGLGCDAAPCGAGACEAGVCEPLAPPDCSQGGPCTQGRCVPGAGCRYLALPAGTPCGECRICEGSVCLDVPDCNPGAGCGCAQARAQEAAGLLALACLALGRVARRRRSG